MTALPELLAAARALLTYSDRRDAELAARVAARREGYQDGFAAGELAGRRGVLEDQAAADRRLHADLAGLASSPTHADLEQRRWHLCCPPCRREGHRNGCQDCQDRTRVTFGQPMPGDYEGGPVSWLPAASVAA